MSAELPRRESDASNVNPLPEDPPEFGEDGLGYLNSSESGGYRGDEDLIMKKSAVTGDLRDDDFKVPLGKSIVELEIERQDAARRDIVWRRRHPTNPFLKVMQCIIPYGGIVSSAFNLASSTLGAGIIAIPAAFQTSGMLMSIIYLIVVALTSVYSFVLLTVVAEKTGLRNWEHITRTLLGRGADYFLAFIMWFLCFGGDVSYVISLGGVIRGFLTHSSSTPAYLKTDSGIRLITSIIWLVAMLPLCLPKEINSLRVVSFVAVMLVVFFVICIVVHSGKTLQREGVRNDLVMFQTGNRAVQGLSIYLFAFISQVNTYEVYGELYKPSVRRMFYSATLGIGMCLVLYFLAGFFGYMDFGSGVKDSVLAMYNPIDDPLMGISYAGIILKLCVGFALHMIPCRDAVYHVLNTTVQEVKWWKNAVMCGALATCALIAGLFIPRITTVFGLLGGFCGAFIGFVFPALFMMYAGQFNVPSVGWAHFIGTYLLLIVGVIGVVFGTIAAIYGEVNH